MSRVGQRVGLVCAYDLSVPGGVQRQVLELAAQLADGGVRVRVLAPGRPVPVPGAPAARGGASRAGAAARSTSAGPVVAVPGNGSVARIGPAWACAGAVRDWLASGLDVVHLHEPLAPGVPQAVLAAARDPAVPPVVATVHAAVQAPLARAALTATRPLLRRRLRRVASLTAVSATAATTAARALGGPAERVDVVGNGVTVDALPPPSGSDRPPTAVAVGRLDEPRKGVDVLLDAWSLVRRQLPQARLVLVGPGRPRGLGGSAPPGVELLGRVDEARRVAALDAADVAVAPHRGSESFGLVVAEAMARGLPVVASALPAFAALLAPAGTERRGGVLVAPGRPTDLAAALVGLLRDGQARAARGRDAHALVQAHAWPRVVDAYRRHYDAAVRRREDGSASGHDDAAAGAGAGRGGPG